MVIDLNATGPPLMVVDVNGDGATDATITPAAFSIAEQAPQIITLRQLDQLNGAGPQDISDYAVHGLIIAALFELELSGKVKQLPGKNFVKSF